jgi:hypothetical protein
MLMKFHGLYITSLKRVLFTYVEMEAPTIKLPPQKELISIQKKVLLKQFLAGLLFTQEQPQMKNHISWILFF